MSAEPEPPAPSVFVVPFVLACVAALSFVALVTGHWPLLLLSGLVLSAAALAKAWSRYGVSRLNAALHTDRLRVFPGDVLRVAAEIENAKLLPVWLQVSVPVGAGLGAGLPEAQLRSDTGLFSFQRASFDWQLTAQHRGVHRLGPLQLQAADPLGFYPRTRQGAACDVIVYPRLIPITRLELPRRDHLGRPGRRSPVEDPTYLEGVRDYHAGRPARYIHWKASARHGRLVEKLCQSTDRQKVSLIVRAERFAEDASGESLERCLSAVASLAEQLDHSQYALGLSTNARLTGRAETGLLPISSSPDQLARVLELLARVEPSPACDLLELLRRGPPATPSVTAVCFSYAADAGWETLRASLRLQRAALVSVICGPHDARGAESTHASEPIHRLEDICADTCSG